LSQTSCTSSGSGGGGGGGGGRMPPAPSRSLVAAVSNALPLQAPQLLEVSLRLGILEALDLGPEALRHGDQLLA